ncbi:ABC transporter ATP-binding protein [Spiroplasma endosymbiont of Diplazon laetatorius]|uniref:ABC transporter ATP-binding protein n=1 Tax=Spiroplasma endosymbiont of Diplazon laetatorius TaxID=3066322 RepID=UPI0030D5BE8A
MIKVNKVSKKIGNNEINRNITIDIKEKGIYGILGPNGAGKTTLIRQIMGFIKPSFGEITLNGINPWNNSQVLMQDVGYVAGEVILFDELTGKEYLDFIKSFKNIDQNKYFEELLIKFNLENDLKTKIKNMSKGTKQKVAIVSALINKPKILILDEPTSGLDPLMQNIFNEEIKYLINLGTTVLMCSHIFEEIKKLCDEIGFLKNGEIIKEIKISEYNVEDMEKDFLSLYK